MTTVDPDDKPTAKKVDWLLVGLLVATATIVILFLTATSGMRM